MLDESGVRVDEDIDRFIVFLTLLVNQIEDHHQVLDARHTRSSWVYLLRARNLWIILAASVTQVPLASPCRDMNDIWTLFFMLLYCVFRLNDWLRLMYWVLAGWFVYSRESIYDLWLCRKLDYTRRKLYFYYRPKDISPLWDELTNTLMADGLLIWPVTAPLTWSA